MSKLARLRTAASDGWRYPALRVQATRQETAEQALAGLGVAESELRDYARAYDAHAAGLYAELAAAAREVGPEAREAARRLEEPSVSSREAKKLLYLAVRALRPEVVAETGTFNGAASVFLLQALEDNGTGRLLSFDLAEAVDALRVRLPAGLRPGWLVPSRLQARFELILGDVRTTLRRRLEVEPPLGLFLHDSLHTTRQMLFEYRLAWRRLRPGGLLVSDDVFWNPAFWAFTSLHRVPFRHIGAVGVTRRP
ncbi:MAG: hypothetical protein QOG06_1838 [Gaiellaceae bacterium]|jgi:predicted O-methyltransferase YrrM|nr:hypothetical protein [Gaiellaceae bacterium]